MTVRALPIIEESIRSGALAGGEQLLTEYKAVFGDDARPMRFPTEAESMAVAGEQIRGKVYVDKIPLSSRLWRNHKEVAKKLQTDIQSALRAGDGMERIAKRIIRIQPPSVGMPSYVQELVDAAGDHEAFKATAKKYAKRIDRLGSAAGPLFDSRTATKQLVRDLRTAQGAEIDRLATRYVKERARQHAVMIARTETIHAYRASYYESVKRKPWVHGLRWTLAASHPIEDICDILASQDLDGLGPGGYKRENVPDNPHPNCMCYTTAIIDEQHFERQQAKRDGKRQPPKPWLSGKRETGSQWLKKQPKEVQRRLLGPTRAKALQRAPNKVIDPKTGKIRRVRDLPKSLRQ